MSLIIFFDFSPNGVVRIILLWIGLKSSSMRGDSRSSSRTHEHENFRLVSQLHVAIQILWSQCPPRRTVRTNRLVVQSQRVSPFCHDLHLRFLSVSLSFFKRSTNQLVILAVTRETCIGFLSTRTGRLFCHNGSWIRAWLGLLVDVCLSSNFWTQFLHPIMSQRNLLRQSRWFKYFLYMISPVSIRTTLGMQQAGSIL